MSASARSVAAEAPAQSARPLLGGIVGLGLAAAGEFLVRSGSTSWAFVLLYLAGIGVFAFSAWWLPPAPADVPAPTAEVPRPGVELTWWSVLVLGTSAAIVLNLAALREFAVRWDSAVGVGMWAASLVVLLLAGFLARRLQEWPARWGVHIWPITTTGKVLLVLAVIAILALAGASRLIALDRIPLGINPDEGDRASTAMRVLSGNIATVIFDYGWFGINILYFWILAQVMQVFGIGVVGARTLGALCGWAAVATVLWMGVRHFGYRVGLMAGGILAALGIALQFSREVSEAGPTALLWTLSAAGLLEAARRGRSAAWIFAGITGGLSIYFYPSGRLWPAVAALFSIYFFLHGPAGRRASIVRGVVLAAIACTLAIAPFMLRASETHWEALTTRARMTTIFVKENPLRLRYYKPEWSTARLLQAQIERSIGIFDRYPDMNGFWPTAQPLFPPLLALLSLIGLGWVCIRVSDPRFMALAAWFWVGFVGVIVTVETPNVQRMATAIPVLAFFPALVLDSIARRVEVAAAGARWRHVGTALVLLVAGALMVHEWSFYFFTYGPMDEWSGPTLMGRMVAEQGTDTHVFSMGRQAHIVNQGWVQLLAPDTPRAGLTAPGSDLPVSLPADSNLAFMVMPEQPFYLPYLRTLYPDGTAIPAIDRGQQLFLLYRVPKEQVAQMQGALAVPPSGDPVHVARLGEAPPGWTAYPTRMRWTAMWRVPQFWNYALRIGPGPARLSIDGKEILTVPDGTAPQSVQVSLAQGDHFVDWDGTLVGPGQPGRFEWAVVPDEREEQKLQWQPPVPGTLRVAARGPDGLFGTTKSEGNPERRHVDGTLMTGNLSAQVRPEGRPYITKWTGTLNVPTNGSYTMSLFAQGSIDLRLDGKSVAHTDGPVDEPVAATIELAAGPHPLEVVYDVKAGAGALEWTWTPPGGERSVVPRSVLSPPPGAGVGPLLPAAELGLRERMPSSEPYEIIR